MHVPQIMDPIIRISSNKRPRTGLFTDYDETDAAVPIHEDKPQFRQSKSAPVSPFA